MVSSISIGIVLSLQTLSTCIIYTLGQYIYTYYLDSYPTNQRDLTVNLPTIKPDLSDQCAKTNLSSNTFAQSWAQQKSANLFFWINVWSFAPIIVMTYVLGLYTPKLGRKLVLLLPMFAIGTQMIIWLSIIQFHLAEYWWYIGAFLAGLSGSDNIRNFVLNLFITDSTIEHERSSRFVYFGAIATIVSALGTLTMGYYIAWFGFTDLFWFGLTLQIISIFIVLFFFKSDHCPAYRFVAVIDAHETQSADSRPSFSSESLEMLRLFSWKDRSKKRSICLLLTLLAYACYSFIATSFIILLLYLLNAPFCWTSKEIGNYSAIALISFGVLSLCGMKLSTLFSISDPIICAISHIFFALAALWTGLAHSTGQMYVGLILCAFSGYQNFLTLPMISKWLKPSERTRAFTLVTEINTIMKMLGYCFFNWIYARTVMTEKNFTFLLACGLSLIPLILNVCLWYVSRSMVDSNSNEQSDGFCDSTGDLHSDPL